MGSSSDVAALPSLERTPPQLAPHVTVSHSVDMSSSLEPLSHGSSLAAKRRKLTQRQVENRSNAIFKEYWAANRQLLPPLAPPPVAAAHRMSAVRARMATRNSVSN